MSNAIGVPGAPGFLQSGGNFYIPKDLASQYLRQTPGSFDDQGNYTPSNSFTFGYGGMEGFIPASNLGFTNGIPASTTTSDPTGGADVTTDPWRNQLQYVTDPSSGQQFLNLGANPVSSYFSNPRQSSWWDVAGPSLMMIGGYGLGSALSAGGEAASQAGTAGSEAGTVGGAGSAGDFGGYAVDPNTGDVVAGGGMGGGTAGSDPFSNIGVDQFGNPISAGASSDPFANIGVDQFGNPIPAGAGPGAAGGGLGMGGLAGPATNLAGRLLGGGQGGPAGGGGGIMDFLTGRAGGPSLPSLAPGLAALQYARQQKPIDTSQLQSVFDQSGANAPLFVQAAQHPLQQAQAGGYGDILQSQGLRGIRGSSFGDQSIANYMTDTNRGIADAGTNAAQAALGLQGSLAGQISNLNALSQQMKNNLYGRAFSSLGQGLNPTPGMGGFGSNAGRIGIPGGINGVEGGNFMGNLGLGGVGNAFGNMLGSVGSGLGNLFGSPGNRWWSGPATPAQGGFNDFTGMWGGGSGGFNDYTGSWG